MLKPIAVQSIKAYQKFISPHKGWNCAHALVHGGPSCSNYGLVVIKEHGVLRGLTLLKARFRECSQATALLKKAFQAYSVTAEHPTKAGFMEFSPELVELINNTEFLVESCGSETGGFFGDCCNGFFHHASGDAPQ